MNVELLRKYTDFKNGETVYSKSDGGEVTYLCLRPETDNHLVTRRGFIFQVPNDDLYQVPLAWKDDRPVYRGDILYYQDAGKEWFGVVGGVNDGMVSFPIVDRVPIGETYWEPAPKYYSADGYLLKWGMKVNVISGDQIFPRVINSFDQDKVIFEGLESPPFAPLKDVFILPPIIFEGSPLRIGDTLYSEKDRQGQEVKNIYENGLRIGEEDFCKNDLHIFSRTPFFWIGRNRVPLPEKEAPERGTYFWVPNLLGAPYKLRCNNSVAVRKWLESGLVHLTEANADIHKEALISLSAELYQ